MEPTASPRSMLIATFRNREKADRAQDVIIERSGYTEKSVIVLRSRKTRNDYFGAGERYETTHGTKAAKGAGLGGALGGVAGGIAGAVAAVGSPIAIPGLGFAIAGPLAAVLTGAGAGGGAGTLIGGLIGAGLSEERPHRYESDIEEGGLVLGVVPRNLEDADYFEERWGALGAERLSYESDGGWHLFKSRLLETYDGITDSEMEHHRGDRHRITTYIHNRTGMARQDVEAGVDEALTETLYTFPSSSSTTAAGSAPSAASSPPPAETASHGDPARRDEAGDREDPVREDLAPPVPPAPRSDEARPAETTSGPVMAEPDSDAPVTSAPSGETSERVEGGWREFKGRILEAYGRLTDDEIDVYRGQREQLIGHVQRKTGKPREEVEAALDRMAGDTGYVFAPDR